MNSIRKNITVIVKPVLITVLLTDRDDAEDLGSRSGADELWVQQQMEKV